MRPKYNPRSISFRMTAEANHATGADMALSLFIIVSMGHDPYGEVIPVHFDAEDPRVSI